MMIHTLAQQPMHTLSPQMLIRLFMVTGILALAYALITQKLLFALGIAILPTALLVSLYCIRRPRFGLILYLFMSYYLTTFSRYTYTEKWSVVLDILLVFIFITILIHTVIHKENIRWLNGLNILTGSYVVWMIFVLIQLRHTASDEYIMAIRAWLVGIPILYFLLSISLDNLKALRIGLIVLGVFTITAFVKVLYQKYYWFDAAEVTWLMQGNWVTHILSTGIRYFSIFSDAGNFGIHMGMATIVYFLIALQTPEKLLRLFYLFISVIAAFCLFMSGTRAAIAVPIAGLALFTLLSLKPKIMITTAIGGVLFYAFFAFTTIGDDNPFIRRMRTAFAPTEDASMNVRLKNRKQISEYLKTHPWGVGLGRLVPRVVEQNGVYKDGFIPSDSHFVRIWMQTGTVGLLIYIAFYVIVLIRCCYIVMFRIRNQQIQLILAALLSGVFGMLVSGYAGEAMSLPPNNFLIPAMLAFVLNGPYIEKKECTSTPITINT
ncbi:MAG: O-antigen ligase family protein [Mediterranea sp.]|jgi:hypothetical protein|nr:O-antigen ligase family protein [Mediterranea sp.]